MCRLCLPLLWLNNCELRVKMCFGSFNCWHVVLWTVPPKQNYSFLTIYTQIWYLSIGAFNNLRVVQTAHLKGSSISVHFLLVHIFRSLHAKHSCLWKPFDVREIWFTHPNISPSMFVFCLGRISISHLLDYCIFVLLALCFSNSNHLTQIQCKNWFY